MYREGGGTRADRYLIVLLNRISATGAEGNVKRQYKSPVHTGLTFHHGYYTCIPIAIGYTCIYRV